MTKSMPQQTTITSYFGKRKRIISDESALNSKKILLDTHLGTQFSKQENGLNKKIYGSGGDVTHANAENCSWLQLSQPEIDVNSTRMREVIQNVASGEQIASTSECKNHSEGTEKQTTVNSESPVLFKLLGSLSPAKRSTIDSFSKVQESSRHNALLPDKIENQLKTPKKQVIVSEHSKLPNTKISNQGPDKITKDEILKYSKELINRIKQSQKKACHANQIKNKKELSLKAVKDKIKQSDKLDELKKSINKINEQQAILIELEKKKQENSVPKLSKFKAIEVDVPLSPQKNALYSPSKVERSPSKPAYERFNFLAEPNATLPLPFAFQKLYELFRAVDTISSMMINRGEDITFSKLKPAVQEMTRKSFTLRHLGQIAAILPNSFNFHQEKVRNFGATSKTDRYELVISPTFPDNPQVRIDERSDFLRATERMSMTPRVIKARREAFYNALLDKTKDCHEEFLKSLDPPMHISRKDLKRWHPNFMVDHVPDIVPAEIPQPPNNERPATAKEVLERAKDFLSSNSRLQKALESASKSSDNSEDITSAVNPDIKQKVDTRLCNPLKGISKSLLERVRARQAAKALDSMRMTPQQEKESVMYTRLPSIARIVRTLFVNEQRGVLSWETALEKVKFSYSRNLSMGDVESQIKLLVELLPEWLSVVHIRNGNYLKMNPAVDLTLTMNKLDRLVAEKAKNS